MPRAIDQSTTHTWADEESRTKGTSKAKSVVTSVRPAGEEHQVVTVLGGDTLYRRTPCSDCPWRKDAVGVFPAEAFRHSAPTAYDMSQRKFACHQSGKKKPAMCAGFLLRGADHNLAVRLLRLKGAIGDDVDSAGHELHDGYAEMAIANGVGESEECLKKCRLGGAKPD